MSERLPDDDNTLEDGPELLRRARAGATPPSDRPDDDTLPADPDQLAETVPADTPSPGRPDDETIAATEADLADAPSQGLPDDDTIDADPELLRQVVAASAAGGAHDGDETVVRDPELLREAQAVTAASHAAPQESHRRRWKLLALAIPIVLVGALAALAVSEGWFGNGPGVDPEETTDAPSSSTPSDDDESAEAGDSDPPISDEPPDPPENEPSDEIVVIDNEEEGEVPIISSPEKPNIDASGGENRATANWSADDNGSPISEWEINDDNMPGGPGRTAASHTWTGVEAGTYTITVRARNAGGWSPLATSDVTVTQTLPERPTIRVSGGENRVTANWSADDNGSPISEWEIDDASMPGGPGRTSTSHTWTGVEAGTYTITVRARNAGGWSPLATSDVTVTQTPPERPTIRVSGGENRVTANWSADDNGSSILEWEINDGGMPGGPSNNAASHAWTGVDAGTYTITVRARNAGGWSPLATSDVTVTQTPPERPTIRVSGGENRVTANWSADDNGSSILEWEIDDGGMPGDAGTAPNATSHTWTGVDAGTYTITVRARNAGGWSPRASAATVPVTDAPIPCPDTPSIEASGGKNRASASWSADDNGSPISEWEINDDNMPGGPRRTSTSHTWTGVDAGTYTITVRARNDCGWSPRATTNVTITQTPPDTPTIGVSGGENRASASWSADDNGSPISEWEINDDNMPGGPGRTAASHTWTGVDAGTYTITVRARNAGGWSPRASATVPVTDAPIPCPDTPSIRASGGENRASASWSADDNGSPISEWEVNDDNMPGGPGRTSTSHTWTGVDAGTYIITVRARNDCGWSPRATTNVAVTQSPPEAPEVEATKENDRINYSATTTNNGSEIDTWEQELLELATRERFAERQRFDADQSGPGWRNVPPGRYVVRLRARNAGGWGDWGESGAIIVEDRRETITNDDPFLDDRFGDYNWWIPDDPGVLDTGHNNDFMFTLAIGNTADDAYDSWARWTFESVAPGRYELEVWIPAKWATAHVEYLIWIDGDYERGRWLDQQRVEGWQSLGEYDVGTSVSVQIRDSRARDDYRDDGTVQTRLAADAMRLRPR